MKIMNLQYQINSISCRGYTLLEAITSTSILSIAFIAFAFSVSQGGRISALANGKLSYTSDSQLFLNRIIPEIREAKDIEIGLWDGTDFNKLTNGVPKLAHAIRVFATTNRSNYTVFYLDVNDDSLKSYVAGAGSPTRLIGTVTNAAPFTLEGFQGNVLSNDFSNYVVGIQLEMKEILFGSVQENGQYAFDNFRLNTKITRRMVE